jgi:chemotaxis protein CheD
MEPREIICRIGEARVGWGRDLLRATLGSCVGIGLLWRARGRCALAHCLLAEATTLTFEVGARYVTQAVPSLIKLLKVPGDRYGELEAVVAGGAQMMGPESSAGTRSIGRANSETAIKCLEELGIRVVHVDVGGEAGRQISIDCESYEYRVRAISRLAA